MKDDVELQQHNNRNLMRDREKSESPSSLVVAAKSGNNMGGDSSRFVFREATKACLNTSS